MQGVSFDVFIFSADEEGREEEEEGREGGGGGFHQKTNDFITVA